MFASFLLSFRPRAGSLRCLSIGAAGLLLSSACAVDSEPLFERVEPLDPIASRPGNLPTFPASGSGGRGATAATSDGVPGQAIAGLISTDAGSSAGGAPAASDSGADAGAACQQSADCDDGNECTLDECSGGACRNGPSPEGAACGDPEQNDCTLPDSCDGAGSCLPRHAEASTPCGRGSGQGCTADSCDGSGACQAVDMPAGTACGDDGGGCSTPACDGAGSCEQNQQPNGVACPGGSCSLGACVAGQPVGCPAALASDVPVSISWSSAGRTNLIQGSCDESVQTPDFALVFSAPSAGQYRIDAGGTADSVLVVRAGACSGNNQLACNDDRNANQRDSRVELTLSAGDTITIYVSEFGNGSSGAGTLQIILL
jgi:hypothetical protein